jgi:RNA exonuclease 1
MVALDCEMVVTEAGYELARATLLGPDGAVLWDELVLPDRPVLDYVTRYSGITAEILEGVKTSLADAQRALLRWLGPETVLVGHGLENDLRALRLVHTRIADTSILFGDERGQGYKPALRRLAARYLNLSIQDSSHDSVTDARTALHLIQLKMQRGRDFGASGTSVLEGDPLFGLLESVGVRCAAVARAPVLSRFVAPLAAAASMVPAEGDVAVARAATRLLRQGMTFVVALGDGLTARTRPAAPADGQAPSVDAAAAASVAPVPAPAAESVALSESEAAEAVEVGLLALYTDAPPNTLLMVVSGPADLSRLRLYASFQVDCDRSG